MGQSMSQQASLAETKHTWLLRFQDSFVKYASSSSLERFDVAPGQAILALAYQASESEGECNPGQNIRYQISKDGGETWSLSKVVAWGLCPCWAPVLFYDQGSRKLFLFYSESRKAYSPGGDIKYLTSEDQGETWSPPVTIYTHEQDGECPKLVANKPVVDFNGNWYLPIQREPALSYRTFAAKSHHPMKSNPSIPKPAVPPTATPQLTTTSAGVLRSKDGGASWESLGSVEHPSSWLIEPCIEIGRKGQLIMMFRTSTGKVLVSESKDKGSTWSKPRATSLPNPNSKITTVTIDAQILCVYNASAAAPTPLALALSVDDTKSFDQLAVIESDPAGKFTSPSIVHWSPDTVKVSYTVWGEGLRLATIRLATAD